MEEAVCDTMKGISILGIVFTNLVCLFTGEHCDSYVKKFEFLFGSNRNVHVPSNGGIN